jgi:DNA-binding beta-propeller fold protein YncE
VTRFAAVVVALSIGAATLPLGAQPLLFHDHGHGLAFSADGKALLAPSHQGLAVFRDESWSEASGTIGGFSGFSVAEQAIYSSGHPAPGARQRDPVGLVRSADGGKTWQSLTLAGEADFHLLAAGYRSGALYVLNTRPNSAMPAPGLYLSRDEGRSWRRSAAEGLEGEIHGMAAHPRESDTVAVGTGKGLYISRDGGDRFRRLDGREPATAVAFTPDGARLYYARALSNQVLEISPEGRRRGALRLPELGLDYVTCIAQNPADERVIAFATRRRDVFLTRDGGRSWRKIAGEDEPQ